jgi:hypothetical protein
MNKPQEQISPLLSVPVEDAYAVWFRASHKFMLLEEPAFQVVKLHVRNEDEEHIANNVHTTYGFPLKDCQRFTHDVISEANRYLQSNTSDGETLNHQTVAESDYPESFELIRYYVLGKSVFQVFYSDRYMENMLHPLIAHLETGVLSADHTIRLFRVNGNLAYDFDGMVSERMPEEDVVYFKPAVFLKILSVLHKVPESGWMLSIHSSCVSDGTSAIVFPAQSKSGKSTLAALLHAHGFKVLSDDLVTIDNFTHMAYEMPLATTVKEGSMEVLTPFFPELTRTGEQRASTGKMVRYLPLNKEIDQALVSFPVKCFVFVVFSPGADFRLEPVSKKEAIRFLLEETWVNPTEDNVQRFFGWFTKIRFYRMQYCETEDAINAITKLFKA